MTTRPKKCETCRQEIKWITLKGKPHPLNTDLLYVSPNGSGKRLMLFQSDGTCLQGYLCKPGDKGAQGGYRSHFATCKTRVITELPRPKAQPVEEQGAFEFETQGEGAAPPPKKKSGKQRYVQMTIFDLLEG